MDGHRAIFDLEITSFKPLSQLRGLLTIFFALLSILNGKKIIARKRFCNLKRIR